MDCAEKMGNVTMRNLLLEKATFTGTLRMILPAKMFQDQRWGPRHCVIVPRRCAKVSHLQINLKLKARRGLEEERRTGQPGCPVMQEYI